jgi:hypothetical protein
MLDLSYSFVTKLDTNIGSIIFYIYIICMYAEQYRDSKRMI